MGIFSNFRDKVRNAVGAFQGYANAAHEREIDRRAAANPVRDGTQERWASAADQQRAQQGIWNDEQTRRPVFGRRTADKQIGVRIEAPSRVEVGAMEAQRRDDARIRAARGGIWDAASSNYGQVAPSVDTGMQAGSAAAAAHAAALEKHQSGGIFGGGNSQAGLASMKAANRAAGFGLGSAKPIGRRKDALDLAQLQAKNAVGVENAKGMWGDRQANTEGMWKVADTKQQGVNAVAETKQKGLGDIAIEKLKGENANKLQELVNTGTLNLEGVKGESANKLQELVNSGAIDLAKVNGQNATALQEWINSGMQDLEALKGQNQALYQQIVNSGLVNVAQVQAAAAGAQAAAAQNAQEMPGRLAASGALAGNQYRLGPNNTVVGPDGKAVDFNDEKVRKAGKASFRNAFGEAAIRQFHNGEVIVGLENVNGQMVPRVVNPTDSSAANLITDYNEIARYDAALAAFLIHDAPKGRRVDDSISAG